MNAKIRRANNMLVAVDEFMDDHPLTPAVPKATAQIDLIKVSIAEIATLAGKQDAGRAEWSGASDERMHLKFKLREELNEISLISKALDPVLYPTARAQFKVNGSFASYINRGHAVLEAIGPIKAAFLEHGLPADFDEALADTIAALEEAGAHTYRGRQAQMNGTAGMREAARRGVRAVRVLDSIVRPKLKSDPALLAVWRATTKIERPPRNRRTPGSAAGVAVVPPAPAAAAPVAESGTNGQEVEQPMAVEPRVNGTAGGVANARCESGGASLARSVLPRPGPLLHEKRE